MKSQRLLKIAVLALCAIHLMASAAQIILAKDGKPAAAIVLPPNAAPAVKAAAEELQLYVKKICGVELPVNSDGKKVQGTGIYLWTAGPITKDDRPAENVNPDTYIQTVRDGNILFTARTPHSCGYGVYDFLERELGVRWFAPGDEWEYVPKSAKPGTLVVNVESRTYRPTISPRLWAGSSYTPWATQWSLRHKVGKNEIRTKSSFQNNIYRIFPPQKYAKEHPEYYPLIDGKRFIPGPKDVKWRPCESNPEVQKIVVEHIRAYFDKYPYIDSFALGLDDVFHICMCPNCVAMDHQPDDVPNHRYSSRHYKFINAIAREVAKTHPDRFIGTLIYNPTRQPPVDVPKMEPNTFGFITQSASLWKVPEKRQADMELTAEWARRIPFLSRYEYIGLSCITPFYFPHLLEDAFRYDLSLNFQGMYQEVCCLHPTTSPMVYALAQLQWDASRKLDDLLNEFMEKMYVEAAPEMKAYFDLLEKSYIESRQYKDQWVYNNLRIMATTITPAQLKEAFSLLARAKAKAKDPMVKKRVQITENALRYGAYLIDEVVLSKEAQAYSPDDTAKYPEFMEKLISFGKLCLEREKFWEDMMKAPDLLGDSLRALGNRGNLSNGQISTIELDMLDAAIAILEKMRQNDPAGFEAQIKRLQGIQGSNFVQTLLVYFSPSERMSTNLLDNPGFERTKPDGTPLSWATWGYMPGKLVVDAGKGRSGNAARVNHNVGAAFMHYRKAIPGERYYGEIWIKGEGVGNGYISFRFQSKGKWYPHREHEPRLDQQVTGEWRRLRLSCVVPEGVDTLQFAVGGNRVAGDAHVLIDDAILRKVRSDSEMEARETFRKMPAPPEPVPTPAGRNLLRNPGFEEASANIAKPNGWYTSGAPNGGSFQHVDAEGRNGSRAFMIYSPFGTVIQNIRVKPGEKYHAEGWFRGSFKAKNALQVRFKSKGKWIADRSKEPETIRDITADWQKIAFTFTVPEEATEAHLMLSARKLEPGEFLLVDDAALIKLNP